jgi:hypothetical protein
MAGGVRADAELGGNGVVRVVRGQQRSDPGFLAGQPEARAQVFAVRRDGCGGRGLGRRIDKDDRLAAVRPEGPATLKCVRALLGADLALDQ